MISKDDIIIKSIDQIEDRSLYSLKAFSLVWSTLFYFILQEYSNPLVKRISNNLSLLLNTGGNLPDLLFTIFIVIMVMFTVGSIFGFYRISLPMRGKNNILADDANLENVLISKEKELFKYNCLAIINTVILLTFLFYVYNISEERFASVITNIIDPFIMAVFSIYHIWSNFPRSITSWIKRSPIERGYAFFPIYFGIITLVLVISMYVFGNITQFIRLDNILGFALFIIYIVSMFVTTIAFAVRIKN